MEGFDLSKAADEIIAQGEPGQEASSESTVVESSTESPVQGQGEVNGEAKEQTPEEILAALAGQKTEEKAPLLNAETLKLINGLGAIRNGTPIEIKDEKQLVELVQKGFDYTSKTMEHSEAVKQFQSQIESERNAVKAERETFEKERASLKTVEYENQLMESVLKNMQANDPIMFEEFQKAFHAAHNEYNKILPFQTQIDSKVKALQDEIAALKGGKEIDGLKSIGDKWANELKEAQAKHGASLNALGVKVDWDKDVQDIWKSDSSGKMTVEQAMFAKYGKDIQNLSKSHQKVLATKAKTATSILNKGTTGRNSTGNESSSAKGMNLSSWLEREAANL